MKQKQLPIDVDKNRPNLAVNKKKSGVILNLMLRLMIKS